MPTAKESINKLLDSKDGKLFKLLQRKCNNSKNQQLYSDKNLKAINQLSAIVDNLLTQGELGETIISHIEKLIQNIRSELFLNYFMPILQAVLGDESTFSDNVLTKFAVYLKDVNFNIEYSESVIDMSFLSTLYQQHNLNNLIVRESPSTSEAESSDPKQERVQAFINSVESYKKGIDNYSNSSPESGLYNLVMLLLDKVLSKLTVLKKIPTLNTLMII